MNGRVRRYPRGVLRADALARPRNALLLTLAGVLIVSGLLLQGALRKGPAFELDEAAYAQAEAAFVQLAMSRTGALPASFTVNPVNEPFEGLLVHEIERSCRGGGTYLVREKGESLPLLISAPHRGSDRFTGTIALQLFLEGRAAATAWNSVRRRNGCDSGSSDLARLRRHPFTAFTVAFARAHPDGRVLQIHGFDPDRRDTSRARAASVILSSGSDRVSPAVRIVADCLRSQFPDEQIAVYPTDVRELGARRNAQGRRLRAIGFGAFVHAEISFDLRQRLMVEPDLRRRFGLCLEAGL